MRRRAGAFAGGVAVPPIVHDVLRSSGHPLDEGTRTFFETRFGHDFSRIRIHTDARAGESAQAVDALAYTVGQDLVFGPGQYAPGTAAGTRVLAHELTHVVQQGGLASPAPLPLSISPLADPLEDEAEDVANQIQAGGPVAVAEHEAAATLHRIPVLPPLVDVVAPMQAAAHIADLVAASCDHKNALTWADFTGTPPARSRFSAQTGFHFDAAAVGGDQVIKAKLDGATSWVRPQAANPKDRAVNGARGQIRACERWFTRETAAGHINITYHLNPGAGCAASIQPDPSVLAHSSAQCTDVLGPEWDRAAVAESARLLQHEQTHYDLACALARKGTMAIMNGGKPADILRAVRGAAATQTASYDKQADHGCNAGPQATWDKAVRDGLPAVNVP
jgi:hypothetical protein